MVSLVRRDNRKDSHVKTLRSFLLSHRHPPSWFKSRLSNPNRIRLDFGAQASGTHPSPASHHNQPRETWSKGLEQEQGERRQWAISWIDYKLFPFPKSPLLMVGPRQSRLQIYSRFFYDVASCERQQQQHNIFFHKTRFNNLPIFYLYLASNNT